MTRYTVNVDAEYDIEMADIFGFIKKADDEEMDLIVAEIKNKRTKNGNPNQSFYEGESLYEQQIVALMMGIKNKYSYPDLEAKLKSIR